MPTEIEVPGRIIDDIVNENRVLVVLPEDLQVPLGAAEFVARDDADTRVAVNVLRTSRAQLRNVPVTDRVLNGEEDLMKTLIRLRHDCDRDLTSEDVVTVVRFEQAEGPEDG
ncbi:MAG: hypothetical protein R6V19_17045 [Armatimonadota bacterium]